MYTILGIGFILLTISIGYFMMGLVDLILDKVLRKMVVNHYRTQTRTAIMEVLSKATK